MLAPDVQRLKGKAVAEFVLESVPVHTCTSEATGGGDTGYNSWRN